jgi:hypothetical protein
MAAKFRTSEWYRSPSCGHSNKKDAQTHMTGEMLADKDASFVMFADPDRVLRCEKCKATVKAEAVARGDYDTSHSEPRSCLTILAGLIATIVAVAVFGGPANQVPWWSVGLIGLIIGGGLERIVAWLSRRRKSG